jgi:hypothetical protein
MTNTTTTFQNGRSADEPRLATDKGDLRQKAKEVRVPSARRGGPKTESGKRAVSQNATTHGITSLSPVAGSEDPTEWAEFKQGWHEYFKPVGVPEEEIVNTLALTAWRRRRIIRREVALIDTRHEAIEEAVASDPRLEIMRYDEMRLDAVGCDVAAGVDFLETLDGLDANDELDPERVNAALGLVFYCGGLKEFKMLPEDTEGGWSATAAAFREWIAKHAAAEGATYEDVLQLALQSGNTVLASQARREQARQKLRGDRKRAAVMPSVQDMDNLVRHEAHLDRSFARGLSQLELLQRQRSGENVPPPERLEVTVR